VCIGIISGSTIDFFSPWPTHALLLVAESVVMPLALRPQEVAIAIVYFLADVHAKVSTFSINYVS
jgi:hypothetical protein